MRSISGFSLIELMLVLTLISMLWVGASHYQAQSQQVVHARQWTQSAVVAIQSIRQRAIAEQQVWQICGGIQSSCNFVWTSQWWAENDNGTLKQRLSPEISSGWRVYWRGFRKQPFISWTKQGDSADSNGTLTLCPPIIQDAAIRQIVISRSGRLRIQVPYKMAASVLSAARQICGW